jgi:MFS family permease
VPIGVVAILALLFKVEETRDDNKDHAIDFPGAIAIALGLAALTFGFLRIPALGFNNWQVIVSLIAGIALLVIFIFIEKKSRHPMMPLYMFANKTFSGANLLTFFLYAGLGTGMLFLSLNMVQAQSYTQLQSGLSFLPFTILMISLARFAGSLADKHGPRLFLIGGPFLAGVGLFILSFVKETSGAQDFWISFFPGIIVFGLGMSFTVAPLTATVMGAADEHLSGTASGINNAVTRIANVFANAVFGALAVLFFSAALQKDISHLTLDAKTKQEVMKESMNLGNANPPQNINDKEKALIQISYHESFISAYQKIMRIAAALAFTGAFMSFLFIRNNAVIKAQDN